MNSLVFLCAIAAFAAFSDATTLSELKTAITNERHMLVQEISKNKISIDNEITSVKLGLAEIAAAAKSEIQNGPSECQKYLNVIESIRQEVNAGSFFARCEMKSHFDDLQRADFNLAELLDKAAALESICSLHFKNCQDQVNALALQLNLIHVDISHNLISIMADADKCTTDKGVLTEETVNVALEYWKLCANEL